MSMNATSTSSTVRYADGITPTSLRRLRSTKATHYGDDGPTVTIVHRNPRSGALLSTTGRLIAETPREVAMIVHGSPVVIAASTIDCRTPGVGSLS